MVENSKDVLLIDIRDVRELWKSGTIENAKHMPRGMLEFWLDPESPYYKEECKPELTKIFILCIELEKCFSNENINGNGF